ncbi:response regulator transcription factor [Sandarakinorhabdus sp. DWP1-3-1]|uniref:response regulator transcription factor n=1 Tax=Sandarakinorhabdus sp. DWP1-3-1 TaxID=2804627 RepID=UPI003CED1C7B
MWDRRIAYHIDNGAADTSALAGLLNSLGIVSRPLAPDMGFGMLAGVEPGCLLIDCDIVGIDYDALFAAASLRRAELPIVVMATESNLAGAIMAMRRGACDFIPRPLSQDILAESLSRVFDRLRGERLVHDQQRAALARVDTLTDREQEVLWGLVAGDSNKVLAYQLGVSIRTIEMHRSNMMNKLGVQSLAAAVRIAFASGRSIEAPAHADDYTGRQRKRAGGGPAYRLADG